LAVAVIRAGALVPRRARAAPSPTVPRSSLRQQSYRSWLHLELARFEGADEAAFDAKGTTVFDAKWTPRPAVVASLGDPDRAPSYVRPDGESVQGGASHHVRREGRVTRAVVTPLTLRRRSYERPITARPQPNRIPTQLANLRLALGPVVSRRPPSQGLCFGLGAENDSQVKPLRPFSTQ
jgi:hypothetical protein